MVTIIKSDPVTGRNIGETIAEALQAYRSGVKPEVAPSDFHQVYYLRGRSGERLGVFKPSVTEHFLNDRYGASEDREAHLAEVANSRLDQYLGTGLVPYTLLMTLPPSGDLGSMRGSFQFYVPEAHFLEKDLEGENFFNPDHNALRQTLNIWKNRNLKLPNFEDLAFFDLITANNDHHFRNILRKENGELVAIDNANSFPWCHHRDLPFYKIKPLHWFKWSALPQAQRPFSDRIIAKINQLDFPRLEEILRGVLVNDEVPSSKEHIEGKICTLRDRIQIIKELAERKVTMREIAEKILQLSNQRSICCTASSQFSALWHRYMAPLLSSKAGKSLLARAF